jgi:hypothetical protein
MFTYQELTAAVLMQTEERADILQDFQALDLDHLAVS